VKVWQSGVSTRRSTTDLQRQIESGIFDVDETRADGEPNEMHVGLCADLALDCVMMVADGFRTEIEKVGNGFAGQS
jgi:hypothetical protein